MMVTIKMIRWMEMEFKSFKMIACNPIYKLDMKENIKMVKWKEKE